MKNLFKFLAIALAATGLVFASDASAATSTSDFVRKATVGNGFEIISSRLALQRSRNPEIRDFAQRMIDDHSQADEDLRDTVTSSRYRMTRMPNNVDAKHRKMLDRLERAQGFTFDKLYVQYQTSAHNEAVALFRSYARTGSNRELREFAARTLPALQEHKDHIRHIRLYR